MTRWNHAFRLTPLAALLLASSAFATNGYFPHGYGIRAEGMGGASVAMTEDRAVSIPKCNALPTGKV